MTAEEGKSLTTYAITTGQASDTWTLGLLQQATAGWDQGEAG